MTSSTWKNDHTLFDCKMLSVARLVYNCLYRAVMSKLQYVEKSQDTINKTVLKCLHCVKQSLCCHGLLSCRVKQTRISWRLTASNVVIKPSSSQRELQPRVVARRIKTSWFAIILRVRNIYQYSKVLWVSFNSVARPTAMMKQPEQACVWWEGCEKAGYSWEMTTLALNSAFYKEHVGRDNLQRTFQSNQVFTPKKIDRCTISEDKYVCFCLVFYEFIVRSLITVQPKRLFFVGHYVIVATAHLFTR